MTYDAVDVADLVQAALLPIRPLAAQRGVRIESRVGPVPVLSADWDALFKILGNLVGNAVKFSNDGGAVRVLVSYDSSAARLSIVVEDEGVGIEPAHLETIFDRFAQAPREEQGRPTGSGLGLFLVRALSEAMGGSATVESELGRGSRFTVIVPAQVAECLNE
uniref:histidine kinase n=1 Tax=Muribaculaceae bacterium Z82 TaxID=2304548 RepID=A0A7C9N9R2_9BACT